MTDRDFVRLIDAARQMVVAEQFFNGISTFPGTCGEFLREDHLFVKNELLSIIADEIHRRLHITEAT